MNIKQTIAGFMTAALIGNDLLAKETLFSTPTPPTASELLVRQNQLLSMVKTEKEMLGRPIFFVPERSSSFAADFRHFKFNFATVCDHFKIDKQQLDFDLMVAGNSFENSIKGTPEERLLAFAKVTFLNDQISFVFGDYANRIYRLSKNPEAIVNLALPSKTQELQEHISFTDKTSSQLAFTAISSVLGYYSESFLNFYKALNENDLFTYNQLPEKAKQEFARRTYQTLVSLCQFLAEDLTKAYLLTNSQSNIKDINLFKDTLAKFLVVAAINPDNGAHGFAGHLREEQKEVIRHCLSRYLAGTATDKEKAWLVADLQNHRCGQYFQNHSPKLEEMLFFLNTQDLTGNLLPEIDNWKKAVDNFCQAYEDVGDTGNWAKVFVALLKFDPKAKPISVDYLDYYDLPLRDVETRNKL